MGWIYRSIGCPDARICLGLCLPRRDRRTGMAQGLEDRGGSRRRPGHPLDVPTPLSRSKRRIGFWLLSAFLAVTLVPGPWGQMAVIAIGAFVGVWLVSEPSGTSLAPRTDGSLSSVGWMALFVGLLFAVFRLEAISQPLAVFSSFFRSGALVFGGGHVVLPLLHQAVVRPGWIRDDAFLAGYGFAQALPGPLFSLPPPSSAPLIPPGGVTGGLLALAAIYLVPSFFAPVRTSTSVAQASRESDGRPGNCRSQCRRRHLLAAAFWSPVCTSAILNACSDLALALAGWAALSVLKAPPWAVVFGLAAIGWIAL